MPGVKGKSGPPANLNAARYPWRSFVRRRALRSEDKWLARMLEHYRGALASDKPHATETQKLVMQNAELARGASLLILREAAQKGYIRDLGNGAWDLQPGLKELVKFLGAERNALALLGLGREAKEIVPDLQTYIAAQAAEETI